MVRPSSETPFQASTLDVPCHNGFIADQVHFAIREALSGIDVGTATLDVIALNLLGQQGRRGQKKATSKKSSSRKRIATSPKTYPLFSYVA